MNGEATHIVRRTLHTDFFSVDASGSIKGGMGGYLDGDYFSHSWAEVITWDLPHDIMPFWDEPKDHINYLELFVIYWALVIWGPKLAGMDETTQLLKE